MSAKAGAAESGRGRRHETKANVAHGSTPAPPAGSTPAADTRRAVEILAVLTREYGEIPQFLVYADPFQLLIAVILSAQTTDRQVNLVTPQLFGSYPNPRALAEAPLADLERIVRPTGYFHTKAKNIRETARAVEERFAGSVPRSMEELTALPGVGRKTANVVRGTIFGEPAVIVDTHFGRVVGRLGFTAERNPERIEGDLRATVPESDQYAFSMMINKHGRVTCHARKPECPTCPITRLCPWPLKTTG